MPQRIQRQRTKGSTMPEGAVYVGRPTRWGNPFTYRHKVNGLVRYQPARPDVFELESRISANGIRHDYFDNDGTRTVFYVRFATRTEIVELYRRTLLDPDRGMLGGWPTRRGHYVDFTVDDVVEQLAGKDLACWCPLNQPCHADVLLAIANGGA